MVLVGFKADLWRPTGFLQCFDMVGLVIWPVKIVPEMTYNVSSGTLIPTHTLTRTYVSGMSTRRGTTDWLHAALSDDYRGLLRWLADTRSITHRFRFACDLWLYINRSWLIDLSQLKRIADGGWKLIEVSLLMHDNAQTHRSQTGQPAVLDCGFEELRHSPYFPDLAPVSEFKKTFAKADILIDDKFKSVGEESWGAARKILFDGIEKLRDFTNAALTKVPTALTRAHQEMRYPNVTWRIILSVYLFTTEHSTLRSLRNILQSNAYLLHIMDVGLRKAPCVSCYYPLSVFLA